MFGQILQSQDCYLLEPWRSVAVCGSVALCSSYWAGTALALLSYRLSTNFININAFQLRCLYRPFSSFHMGSGTAIALLTTNLAMFRLRVLSKLGAAFKYNVLLIGFRSITVALRYSSGTFFHCLSICCCKLLICITSPLDIQVIDANHQIHWAAINNPPSLPKYMTFSKVYTITSSSFSMVRCTRYLCLVTGAGLPLHKANTL
jgi:hypothetical protein